MDIDDDLFFLLVGALDMAVVTLALLLVGMSRTEVAGFPNVELGEASEST